jgi:biopolymer transport protein TolR
MVKSARAKRMKKHHKRHGKSAGLNLVSLMDIFTILVFFLLVNSSDVETLPNAKDLQLPESIAEEKARETVVILIGEEDIIVQGTPVAKIDEVMAIKGNDIPALREALLSQNDRVLRREANEDIANREVTIMGDKEKRLWIYRFTESMSCRGQRARARKSVSSACSASRS